VSTDQAGLYRIGGEDADALSDLASVILSSLTCKKAVRMQAIAPVKSSDAHALAPCTCAREDGAWRSPSGFEA